MSIEFLDEKSTNMHQQKHRYGDDGYKSNLFQGWEQICRERLAQIDEVLNEI